MRTRSGELSRPDSNVEVPTSVWMLWKGFTPGRFGVLCGQLNQTGIENKKCWLLLSLLSVMRKLSSEGTGEGRGTVIQGPSGSVMMIIAN